MIPLKSMGYRPERSGHGTCYSYAQELRYPLGEPMWEPSDALVDGERTARTTASKHRGCSRVRWNRETGESKSMKATWIATLGFFLVVGLPLAASAGPNLDTSDMDGDTIPDAFDNCKLIANVGQTDKDHNGCGDACSISCDVNDDGVCGGAEFACVIGNFGKKAEDATDDCDCNDNGVIGGGDFALVLGCFGKTSGPTGIPLDNPLHNHNNCFPKN